MLRYYAWTVGALWLALIAYWIYAAIGAKPVARTETWQSRLLYSAPLWIVGIVMLGNGHWQPWPLPAHFVPIRTPILILGTFLTAAGTAFAIWARVALGANWSGEVTVKENHDLVTTGPYGLTRHPIYTGILLAFVGTAIVVGQYRAILCLVLLAASFWYKLGIEERLMRETFGQAYDAYALRVKALVPFIV
jgi:protein-S-isoprenylcysteine O-methyltransferase Ste14